jgi:hypothetical protein
MAAPSMMFTAKFVARSFGVDVKVIEELAEQMEPADGHLSVIDSLDETAESVTAFTPFGLDYLGDLLDDLRTELLKGT